MVDELRISASGLKVLRELMGAGSASRSGAEIGKVTGVGSGTLYPLLARFEAAGWCDSAWEDVDPREAGRPRRRLYRLTGVGQTRARAELAPVQVDHHNPSGWRPAS